MTGRRVNRFGGGRDRRARGGLLLGGGGAHPLELSALVAVCAKKKERKDQKKSTEN